MAYGFRDSGSPLIGLIESYRQERLRRDLADMDDKYNRDMAAAAAARWEIENAQNVRYQDATLKIQQDSLALQQRTYDDQRADVAAGRDSARNLVYSYGTDDDFAARVSGASGSSALVAQPTEDGYIQLGFQSASGESRPFNNNNPYDNTLPAAKVRRQDAEQFKSMYAALHDRGVQLGLSPRDAEAYARAGFVQGEDNVLRVASPEEYGANMKRQGLFGTKPQENAPPASIAALPEGGSPAAYPTDPAGFIAATPSRGGSPAAYPTDPAGFVAERQREWATIGSIPTAAGRAGAQLRVFEDTMDGLGAMQGGSPGAPAIRGDDVLKFGKKAGEAIGEFFSGYEGSTDAKPDAKQPAYVKSDGSLGLNAAKAKTPEQVIESVSRLQASGAVVKPSQERLESVANTVSKGMTFGDNFKPAAGQRKAVAEALAYGVIDAETAQNLLTTGLADFSTADLVKLGWEQQEKQASVTRHLAEARKAALESKELKGGKGSDIFDFTSTTYKNFEGAVTNVFESMVAQHYGGPKYDNDDRALLVKGLKATIPTMLTMPIAQNNPEFLTSPELLQLVQNVTPAMASNIKSGVPTLNMYPFITTYMMDLPDHTPPKERNQAQVEAMQRQAQFVAAQVDRFKDKYGKIGTYQGRDGRVYAVSTEFVTDQLNGLFKQATKNGVAVTKEQVEAVFTSLHQQLGQSIAAK